MGVWGSPQENVGVFDAIRRHLKHIRAKGKSSQVLIKIPKENFGIFDVLRRHLKHIPVKEKLLQQIPMGSYGGLGVLPQENFGGI